MISSRPYRLIFDVWPVDRGLPMPDWVYMQYLYKYSVGNAVKTVFIGSSVFQPQAFFKKMNFKIIVTFCHLFSLLNVSHVNAVFAVHCDVIHGLFGALRPYPLIFRSVLPRTVGERIKEHLADIKHKREKTVAIHFNVENHTFLHMKQSLTKVLVTWWSFGPAQYKLLPVWILFLVNRTLLTIPYN